MHPNSDAHMCYEITIMHNAALKLQFVLVCTAVPPANASPAAAHIHRDMIQYRRTRRLVDALDAWS
jgi:hypothetical protein